MSMTVSALFVAPSGRRREQRLARHRHGCGERRRQPRREPVGCGTDAAGRLASVTVGGVVQAEYKYNHLGQQVVRTSPDSGQSTHSVYGPDGNRIAEFDAGSGALIREYVWFEGAPIAVIEGGVVYFVRSDHIGRPVFATTSAGTVVWTASYLPFGGVHVGTGAPIDARFPGQWFQAESGLHQNWMRDYDPTTGRYLEPDPLGLVDGASVYGYARGNPGRWGDPRGESALDIVSGTAGADLLKPDRSDLNPGKWAAYGAASVAAVAIDAISEMCSSCPPCSPYPVGTVGYQGPETHQRGRDAGVPHYHLFEVEQIPSNCECIWKEATKRLSGSHHAYAPIGSVNLNGRRRPPPYP